jgi:tripartite-type tricarboxylate transporter receptor subunit TctC
VVSALHRQSLRAMSNPEVIASMGKIGQERFTHDSPAQFLAFMQKDAPRWAKLAKASGASID